ncbi:MAG TPA: membrane protein insertion efficiency factor YidD [Solirubrobacterales bacterium]|nr:membrane protein insertion efficiency factor YidD [Solirubrobacterales bacterium]
MAPISGVSRETGPSAGPDHAAVPGYSVSRETEGTPPPAAGRGGPVRRAATAVLLAPIRFYRRFISPLGGPRCRYYPTCSTYAEQAVRELGPVRGTILAGWRVVRCNPFSAGGLDPLENRRLFRSDNPGDRDRDRPEATT